VSNAEPTPEHEFERRRYERIIDRYLDECYATRTHARASELSRNLGADRRSVSDAVGRLFGKSLKAVLLEKQLAVAVRLLAVTSLPASEIGKATSFGHRSTFHRVFKRAYGMTPKEYRLQAVISD
jgi:AraC-like DNA-binding protein